MFSAPQNATVVQMNVQYELFKCSYEIVCV